MLTSAGGRGSARLLRLPLYTELEAAVQDEVIEAVTGFKVAKNRGIGPEVSHSQRDSEPSTAVK